MKKVFLLLIIFSVILSYGCAGNHDSPNLDTSIPTTQTFTQSPDPIDYKGTKGIFEFEEK